MKATMRPMSKFYNLDDMVKLILATTTPIFGIYPVGECPLNNRRKAQVNHRLLRTCGFRPVAL